ncbi:MAG: RNA methyltransferase [Ignavibacteriales bacterium]|nr:RNA methyltransferase [Ignavibacteriales bacterium]
MPSERRIARFEYVLKHRQPDLTVVMENIHDPHNVSAMLRSCDAAGVWEAQLLYNSDAFPKIGKKSSASAGKWVGRRKYKTVSECYGTLRSEGFRIYATRLDEKARSLYDIDLTQKVALVFGNEHRGVSDEAAEDADGMLQIPMFGMIQSLNVSVACAITLYEALRQRLLKNGYGSGKFSKSQYEELLETWMKK